MQQTASSELASIAQIKAADRMAMMITTGRVVYAGLLGALSSRALGSVTIYIARDAPFSITWADEKPQEAYLAAVPPNTPHVVRSKDGLVWVILVEPECVDATELRRQFPPLISTQCPTYLHARNAFERWLSGAQALEPTDAGIDQFFLGGPLRPRNLDDRIKHAVELIRARPCERYFAAECAHLTGLSFSRFAHLFKEQIGMTFRAFCAWKRARTLLPYVTSTGNLTELALQMGYPDSTHFSHSIRRIYGLRPRDIMAGSRKLTVLSDSQSIATLPTNDGLVRFPETRLSRRSLVR